MQYTPSRKTYVLPRIDRRDKPHEPTYFFGQGAAYSTPSYFLSSKRSQRTCLTIIETLAFRILLVGHIHSQHNYAPFSASDSARKSPPDCDRKITVRTTKSSCTPLKRSLVPRHVVDRTQADVSFPNGQAHEHNTISSPKPFPMSVQRR